MHSFDVTLANGELAEWSIAAVLKTVEPKGSGGSNPSLSAIITHSSIISKGSDNLNTILNLGCGSFGSSKFKLTHSLI